MKLARFSGSLILATALLSPAPSNATGWCDLSAENYYLITHGTKSNKVWVVGRFEGSNEHKWIPIADSNYGASSVALVLAAQLAGKGISVYLDADSETCTTYTSWSGVIRHVRFWD